MHNPMGARMRVTSHDGFDGFQRGGPSPIPVTCFEGREDEKKKCCRKWGVTPLWKTVKTVTKRQRRPQRWPESGESAGISRLSRCECAAHARKGDAMKVRLVQTNIHGAPCGTSHHWARHSDESVARAKELRLQGLSYRAIAKALDIHRSVIWAWVAGKRRKPAARVVARRIRSESFVTNHQQISENPAPARAAGAGALFATVKNTVKNKK
ncbi:MAG: hypothetical protein RIS88_1688 [Pseudomonadota bacterium]